MTTAPFHSPLNSAPRRQLQEDLALSEGDLESASLTSPTIIEGFDGIRASLRADIGESRSASICLMPLDDELSDN